MLDDLCQYHQYQNNLTKVNNIFTKVNDIFTKVNEIFTKVNVIFTKLNDIFTKANDILNVNEIFTKDLYGKTKRCAACYIITRDQKGQDKVR